MLIRVRGTFSGQKLKDYLERGHKAGREFTRDELDERMVLAGNLDNTTKIIENMDRLGQRALHITLAFKEDHLSAERLQEIVDRFEKFTFSAFRKGEYDYYAEAHIPRIKGYEHAQNGKYIERKPHIHIIIPLENLENGMHLNPFGRVEWQELYLDAFQEYINNELGLASPKDNPALEFNDASEMFKRYSGKDFKNERRDERKDILRGVIENKIESWDDFESILKSRYGDTVVRLANKNREPEARYFNVRPGNGVKGLALNDGMFKRSFIELPTAEKLRQLSESVKAEYIEEGERRRTPQHIEHYLTEWHATRALEVRYVFNQSKAYKAAYKAATPEEKRALIEQRAGDVAAVTEQERERIAVLVEADTDAELATPVPAVQADQQDNELDMPSEAQLEAELEAGRPMQPGDVTEYLLQKAEQEADQEVTEFEQESYDERKPDERGESTERDALSVAREDLRAAAAHLRASGRIDALTDDAIRANAEAIAEFASADARELGKRRERGEPAYPERISARAEQRIEELVKGGMTHDDARSLATAEHDLRAADRAIRSTREIDRGAEQAARANRADIALAAEAAEFRNREHGRRPERAAAADDLKRQLPDNWQDIKQNLKAETVLAYLSQTKEGIDVEKYVIGTHRDGSARIKCGSRNLTVSDFLTKEIGMDFYTKAMPILKECYELQQLGADVPARSVREPISDKRRALWEEFREWRDSEGQTRRRVAYEEIKRTNRADLGEIRQTRRDERNRLLDSWRGKRGIPLAVKDAELSRVSVAAAVREADAKMRFREQRDAHRAEFRSDVQYRQWLSEQAEKGREEALAELRKRTLRDAAVERTRDRSAELSRGDPAAKTPDAPPLFHDMTYRVDRYGDVTYRSKGEDLFRDSRSRVSVLKHDADTIETALRLAVMKFGKTVKLNGNDEFKRRCAEIAVTRDVWIEFRDPAVARMVEELRAERDAARVRPVALQSDLPGRAPDVAPTPPPRNLERSLDAELAQMAENERQAVEEQKRKAQELEQQKQSERRDEPDLGI